jgi:hypothetical protein
MKPGKPLQAKSSLAGDTTRTQEASRQVCECGREWTRLVSNPPPGTYCEVWFPDVPTAIGHVPTMVIGLGAMISKGGTMYSRTPPLCAAAEFVPGYDKPSVTSRKQYAQTFITSALQKLLQMVVGGLGCVAG